jgi:hypothetical protein
VPRKKLRVDLSFGYSDLGARLRGSQSLDEAFRRQGEGLDLLGDVVREYVHEGGLDPLARSECQSERR